MTGIGLGELCQIDQSLCEVQQSVSALLRLLENSPSSHLTWRSTKIKVDTDFHGAAIYLNPNRK